MNSDHNQSSQSLVTFRSTLKLQQNFSIASITWENAWNMQGWLQFAVTHVIFTALDDK